MNSKIYLILIAVIAIGFLSMPGKGEETFNETFYFAGGGTNSETTVSTGTGLSTVTTNVGSIYKLTNNFDNQKIITKYVFYNAYYRVGTGAGGISLTGGADGINSKFTSMSSTVSGQFFGNGSIGWVRTTGTNFRYEIIFDYVDETYARTITGNKEIVLTYDKTIFSNYMTADGGAFDGSDCTYSYYQIYVVATLLSGPRAACSGNNAQNVVFTFADTVTLTFNNLTGNFGWVNLTKNNYNTRLQINNSAQEILYDITSITNEAQYTNKSAGIGANVRSIAATGWANRTLVNSQGKAQAAPTPTPPPPNGQAGTNQTTCPKPNAGARICYDKTQYILYDNINVTWHLSDDIQNNIQNKKALLYLNNNFLQAIDVTSQSGYYIAQATASGTFRTDLKQGIFAGGTEYPNYELVNSSSVLIVPPGNSWLALNQTVAYAKQAVNVTYHIGYSVSNYPAAAIEIDTIDLSNGNLVDAVFPTIFPDGNVLIGQIHTFPAGNYSVRLFDNVKNTYLDTKYLTVILNPSTVPVVGITTPTITTDRTTYFYNDYMQVDFKTDDINYSNYSIRGEIFHWNSSLVTRRYYTAFEEQVGTFTTLINIDKTQKCEQKLNCWFDTGISAVRIVAYNSTNSFTVASTNITVSSTTLDGYGLQVSTTSPQKGVAFTVTTIIPAAHTGRMRIVDPGLSANFSLVNQVVNAGTNIFPVIINRVNVLGFADYNVELYGDDGILKVRIPIHVSTTTTPITGAAKNARDQIDFWTSMFGMGLNDTSRLLFAVVVIALTTLAGFYITKNNVNGGIILGAIPFIFFALPPIDYLPRAFSILYAIMIALKIGWFK